MEHREVLYEIGLLNTGKSFIRLACGTQGSPLWDWLVKHREVLYEIGWWNTGKSFKRLAGGTQGSPSWDCPLKLLFFWQILVPPPIPPQPTNQTNNNNPQLSAIRILWWLILCERSEEGSSVLWVRDSGLTFTWWGCYSLCLWYEPAKLARFFILFLCPFLSSWPFQLYFIP